MGRPVWFSFFLSFLSIYFVTAYRKGIMLRTEKVKRRKERCKREDQEANKKKRRVGREEKGGKRVVEEK